MISLRKLIAYASGIEPQISGGLGLNINDPIIILENHHSMAVELERFVAEKVAVFYGMWEAEIGRATLLQQNDRVLDELQISHENKAGELVESRLFFDITEAYKNVGKTLEHVKSAEELKDLRSGNYFTRTEPTPHFYAAVFYAFTLKDDEDLNTESLISALNLDSAQTAEDLIEKLKECGF